MGEYTRTKRACSQQITYNAAINDLNKRLRIRGYDNKSLTKASDRMHNRTRESLLFQSKTKDTQIHKKDDPLILSTPYCTHFSSVKKIIYKYLPVLNKEPKL